ncbi:hypothetical protein [Nonomuraea zeae]|uniref:Uncharacterized protein n=1 Tax=Nonomuraea zeae TaxID=1642303 RepID=A0A5S4GWQ0_9ACTN|nr:hypothetical protein [Nonomuraea zeae]TMR37209.1 hypothetical protein ETD85_08780 [Nonomuraea zeae]
MPSVRRQHTETPRLRWGTHTSIGFGFLAGGLATAGLAMLAGGLVAWAPLPIRMAAVSAILLMLGARELGRWRIRLPQRSRLIPSERLELPFPWGSFAFAAELGLGWRTVVPTSLPYGLVVFVALHPTWQVALAAGLGWAAGRWVPVSLAVRRRALVLAGVATERSRSPWPIVNSGRLSLAGLVILLGAALAAFAA